MQVSLLGHSLLGLTAHIGEDKGVVMDIVYPYFLPLQVVQIKPSESGTVVRSHVIHTHLMATGHSIQTLIDICW